MSDVSEEVDLVTADWDRKALAARKARAGANERLARYMRQVAQADEARRAYIKQSHERARMRLRLWRESH
jgi:hypothetical protein